MSGPRPSLRILYWTEAYWPFIGGTEVMSVTLLRGLIQRGHSALVVTERYDGDLPEAETHDGIDISRFRFRDAVTGQDPTAFFTLLSDVLDVARAFSPDLVHLGLPGPSVLTCLEVARRLSVPLVFTHQMAGMWAGETAPDQLIRRAADQAEWVVFPSEAMAAEARASGIVNARAVVVPNGVRIPDDSPAPLPWDPPVLLGLGRLSAEKGFDLFVDAVAMLRERDIDVRAVLAGEGAEAEKLRDRAWALGLRDVLEFPGWISPETVPELLRRATLLVAPSRAESFGLSALEAQLAGRPVVATAVGGLPEVVRDGETGRVVPPEDPRALADALAGLLADRALTERLGIRARAMTEREFSVEKTIDAYIRIYQDTTYADKP